MNLVDYLLRSFRRRPKLTVAAGFLCLAALGIVSVALPHAPPPPARLRVGYSEFHPYVGVDQSGGPTGLAVQVVREAAAEAGIRLEWVRVADAEAALRYGQADIYPMLTVTPERQRDFYFSVPWWESSQALLSPRERPLPDIPSVVGKRLAIRDLSATAPVAAQHLKGASLVRIPDPWAVISQVCSGQVDGAMLDGRLVYEGLLRQPPECSGRALQLVPVPETTVPLGTASTRAVGKTAGRLYDAIERLAANGRLTELSNRWFVMPQQHFVEAELTRRHQTRLLVFFVSASIVLIGVSAWYWRGTMEMRRAAMAAWSQAKRAEDRFEAFMSNTPVIKFIKDAQGRHIYVNAAFTRHFGMTVEECYGKTNAQLFSADVAAAMESTDQEVLTGGKPVQYVLSMAGDNGPRHFLTLKFPLLDQAGHPGLGGTAIDITEQERAAELVKHSEERYRGLFENAPVAIHEIDDHGRVSRVNRSECALLGYPQEQIIGRHASYFAAPDERAQSVAAVSAKLQGLKKLAPFERRYQRADGRVINVEVHETPILDQAGGIRGIRTCLIDLTERYEAQERLDRYANELREKNEALGQALTAAQEATRLKGQFLANMSHEIRTPLNGILGMTELLLGSGLSPEQGELARCVSQSGGHLLNVINDILDVSKIEAGKVELERTPFDLAGVVEAVMDLMAPSAHAKNVEMSCWVAPEVPGTLVGDAARVRQVLLNLVGNAVKFTTAGEVAVRVTAEPDSGPELTVRVTVADTGIGIPAHAQARLFSAFMQADSSTTRKYGGTGLGLTIAQRIVALMGGMIGLESVEGQGSTFWFTCPLGKADSSEPGWEDSSLAGVKVLLAGDRASSRSALERYARHWGMLPETADSAAEILDKMRQNASTGTPFRLAIIDQQIPGMAAVAREIQADAGLQTTPVVILTAIGGQANSTHVAACQNKPVKRKALFECLCGVLRGSETACPEPIAAPPARSEQPPPASGRVLVAEDNPVNQRVARLQVERLGFAVDVVGNGEEALSALERLNYALVLMDCQMPGMDGYEATRALRLRENGRRRTPVIAMTANAFAQDQQACMEAGMDDYISKPVDLKTLRAKLEQWGREAKPALR